jgi:hypothetical protein
MKSFKIILTSLLILSCHQLYSQVEFSNRDAINIYKSSPTKYGFEGIYEIYYRAGVKIENIQDPNNKYDNIAAEEYVTQNVKVCIYTTPLNQVYFKLITEGVETDKEFYDFWFASLKNIYKVDQFGILTNVIHYAAKDLWAETDQDFVTRIYNSNNTLSYDVKVYGLKWNGIDKDMHAMRWQFLLKKIYTPK